MDENTKQIEETTDAPEEISLGGAQSNVDTAPVSGGDDGVIDTQDAPISLDELSDDEEEASSQLAAMDPALQKRYMALIESGETKEPDAPETNEGDPAEVGEAPMGIDQKLFASFNEKQRGQVEALSSKMAEMDAIDVNNFREGLQKFENDPMLKARLEQLNGSGVVMNDQQVQKAMSLEAIEGLGLDFRMHPEKSLGILQNHLQNTVHNAISNVVDTYEAGNKQRESSAMLDRELDLVKNTYEEMQSDLSLEDASHPMNDFMGWLHENGGGINIRAIGGKVAYEAYLNSTGKSKGIVANAVARGQQDMVDKLRNADKKVATLPRRSNVQSQSVLTKDGIDVNRLKVDQAYTMGLLDKYDDNSKMRAEIERLVIG